MIKLILILLAINSALFGQYSPNSYQLGEKKLSKISALTPASNSVLDIIANDDLIILGTSRGLSLSEDNGENWDNFYEKEPFGSDGSVAIGYDNGVIWVTTAGTIEVEGELLSEGTGIKYSTDKGLTWTSIPQPVDDPGDSSIVYGINTLRALPVTTTIKNISYDIAFTKNTIWISSFAGGLRKSSDMGATWERVVLPPDTLDSISPNDTLNFALQPVAGAFGTDNWLNHRVFSVLGVDDSTLYVGTAGGINKSTDNGISWRKFNHKNQTNPISGNFVVGLGLNEADNSIWAATWKAEDLDEFWGVSHSSDGGENWEVTLPEAKAYKFGFKYFNSSDFHVLVPADKGIFRSSNNGGTWVQPTTIRDSYTNIPIATNIFYATAAKKLNATDYHIWVGSNNGLARLSETNGFWEGDWKVYLASTEVKLDETYAFPNPFSPAQELVKIKYSLSEDAKVTIRIMNFSMQLVRVLIQNAQRGTGELFEFWDGKNELGNVVTNGVYFYRIDSDAISEPLFGKIMVMK
ncbi:MAG: hypothetical protein L3J41_03840 [Melioribacteraceae bacterium]|nr:hypothetical protein [Melioribacteraceae bacterium]